MTDPDVAAIAAGLDLPRRQFLNAVISGGDLGLADRAADRVRQSLRKAGLVRVAKNPRRWVPTKVGRDVAAHLASPCDKEVG